MTRWLERTFARPAVFGTIAGVLFLCGSSHSTAARGAREAQSDSPSAASAPFLRATAPHRVDAGAHTQRRAMPHADNRPPALFAQALPIDAFDGGKSPRTSGTWQSAVIVARGYDATAPPRLLN